MNVLTIGDVAEMLHISTEEAEILRRRHRWPHVDLGWGNIRFTPEQLEAIVELHSVDRGRPSLNAEGFPRRRAAP